jgi:hypothetical protein
MVAPVQGEGGGGVVSRPHRTGPITVPWSYTNKSAWENRIDDPLPVRWGRSRKKHLHETIKNLNRGQKPWRIRFRGDGTASGLRWKRVIAGLRRNRVV